MRLLVIGAGGHGRVVADTADASRLWDEVHFLDDRFPDAQSAGAWKIVGRFAALEQLASSYSACAVAISDSGLRLKLLDRASRSELQCPPIIHPHSVVSRHAEIGMGSVILAGAVVNVAARLERGVIVNTGATVDHDCTVGEGAHICPGAHLAGNVLIGAGTWFGIGAVAKQGIQIGRQVMVAAGAVCVNNIPDSMTVAGIPARELQK